MIDRLNAALRGRYRIEDEVGEGGMATVYLAEDLKHKRQVALKVLRPELAAVVGAERFLAEIETTAGLQHPHILPLFDSGQADGFLFYVMPYVVGDSLRDRLDAEHQLPVEDALEIASKVASALQYAHEQGVVHRDIKPANILLSRGEPLVADFGIALALSEAGEGRITETGLSLGTPHYMSPEQASGEHQLDPRSDVYALGSVLYEMLAGQPPYGGPTAQAVLAQILTEEPSPLTRYRKAVPVHVEHAVRKALEKIPADRFESAEAFVRALRNPAFRHLPGEGASFGQAVSQRGWKWTAWVAMAGFAVLAALQLLGLTAPRSQGPVQRQRLVLGVGFDAVPRPVSQRLALAPDGSGILFADTAGRTGNDQYTYWWKPRDQIDPVPVSHMEDALAPTFSPDGEWVAYIADNQLRKQPLQGGATVLLVDSLAYGGTPALAWLESGELVYENRIEGERGMRWVSDDGRRRGTVATGATVFGPIHASGLRGGGGALVSVCLDSGCSETQLVLLDLARDTVGVLARGVLRAWHVPGDHVVYVNQEGSVFAAALDRGQLRLGPPAPLFDGVQRGTNAAEMQVGHDGSVVFAVGAAGDLFTVVWVDRDGRVSTVDPEWRRDRFRRLSLSPGGDRLAISVVSSGLDQIWVKELPKGPLTRLTVGAFRARRPVWTRDGRHVAYITRTEDGPWHARFLRADGSSPGPDTMVITDSHIFEVLPPDDRGRILIRTGNTGEDAADVGMVDPQDGDSVTWLLRSPFNETSPARSPDGRWLAYVSDLSGREEVYVRRFPDVAERRVQVSTNGGTEPGWSHTGSELFYRDGDGYMTAAQIRADSAFQVLDRQRLFDARPFSSLSDHRNYDVARDDQRFVMLQRVEPEDGAVRLILVENWFTELREMLRGR